MKRPSTHPAEEYRRALAELQAQAANLLHLLAKLDADEAFFATDELEQLLGDVLDSADTIAAGLPLPRQRMDVPVGDLL